ncbi:putative uncharacterized protein [Clostridium sp. CAG:609]|nr:putative uncharacterized protein [Clostridium sp. CAG:609]
MNIDRLREIRKDRDIKQEDVAKALGIKRQQYSEYEIGKRLIPLHYISDLADFYNVSVDYLIGRTDTKEPYKKSILAKQNNSKHEITQA